MGITKQEIEKQKIERLGEIGISSDGYEIKIVEYNETRDIIIEFQDEHKARTRGNYQQFQKGAFKNPYHRSVCGVGYLGEGEYKVGKDGKHTSAYKVWIKMLQRCYDAYYINKRPTYIDCYVCEKWHNFQNFAKWFYKNYYEIEGQQMHLDKDILYKGNKIYSPNTCVFVPERINALFTKGNKIRGIYPIGVHKHLNRCLVAQCSIFKDGERKFIYLGSFSLDKPFQAFYSYKVFKENYIKQVADEYKDLIPKELYDAMYKYEVEIND